MLAVALWWHVWSTHPSTVTTCGCDDPSLFAWFLEWPAYALAHGHNPFYSTALFHPTGINLLSNTSVLAIGIPLAPVTWLFGPVATLNVASTLGPALSALAMFWLLRRWVTWAPAAFVGGLVFGFAPVVVDNMAVAHLNLVGLALLPLMVALPRRAPAAAAPERAGDGLALGVLVAVQFFVSTEMLVMAVLFGAARRCSWWWRTRRSGTARELGGPGPARRTGARCGGGGDRWCSWPTRSGSRWRGRRTSRA